MSELATWTICGCWLAAGAGRADRSCRRLASLPRRLSIRAGRARHWPGPFGRRPRRSAGPCSRARWTLRRGPRTLGVCAAAGGLRRQPRQSPGWAPGAGCAARRLAAKDGGCCRVRLFLRHLVAVDMAALVLNAVPLERFAGAHKQTSSLTPVIRLECPGVSGRHPQSRRHACGGSTTGPPSWRWRPDGRSCLSRFGARSWRCRLARAGRGALACACGSAQR